MITIPRGKGARKLAPVGNHVARCVHFIDLGTQKGEWKGAEIINRKIQITWELPNEKVVFNEEAGEQPFLISKEYTLSMSEKANFRKDLESWRSKPFTEEEAYKLDEKTILGKACMLNVVHQTSASGNEYEKITAVTPLPKGMDCPDQINDTIMFYMGAEVGEKATIDLEVFESIKLDWLKEKIASSPEFQDAEKPDGYGVVRDKPSNLPF